MWSLPDINTLNSDAAKNAKRLIKEAKKVETDLGKCEYNHTGECAQPISKYVWYDIFSDDPKSVFCLCGNHDCVYGNPNEGFFTCDDCCKVFITNYTWENYYVNTDDGETLCLNCYFDRELKNKDNWVDSSFTKLNNDEVFSRIKQAKHLIPVEGTHWKKHLKFIGNCEFDSMDGHQISGDDIRTIVKKALTKHRRAIIILDGGYQFAVSMGVYVKK